MQPSDQQPAATERDAAVATPATATTYASDDDRWAAVQVRDRAADGHFFYSVMTTGVYCRPSCAARPALHKNVAFHATPADAERAGFRPCKRCRPDQASLAEHQASLIADACRRIEAAAMAGEDAPSLDTLADAAHISRYHFHRLFRKTTGVTPKAYATLHRTQQVKQRLSAGSSVTDAIYDAGYNASSRFYEHAQRALGMKPSDYREGGRGQAIRFAIAQCSLGAVIVAATDRGVTAIEFGDDAQALLDGLQDRFPKARLEGGNEDFEILVAQVIGVIEAQPGGLIELPLDVRGTVFQQRVWRALRDIPVGSVASYAEIAERVGNPRAARAVAKACAANPTAIAIPCHRVVKSDGAIAGYRWGVTRKTELLVREGARHGAERAAA